MSALKTLSLKHLFIDSANYCVNKWHEMALFSIINVIFLIVGFKILNAWHDRMFLLWLVPYYVFWYYFFRFYFGRKPYMMTLKIFGTLLPSTRILLLTLLFMTLLIAVPLIIPFISGEADWVEIYLEHLQHFTESGQMMDAGMLLIFTLISPIIFYRPMMAWIGSVIGRSGKLSTAFARTKGNYWQFVILTIVFNLFFILFDAGDEYFALNGWVSIFAGSPLTIYINVVLAKAYEYFFLDIE